MSPGQRYKVVDLFAGCGGLSRGLEATGRFGTQFAAEIEPHPARTFAANITNVDGKSPQVYTGDVRDLADDPSLLWRLLNNAGIDGPGEVDLLAGGPPCQGFSRNGVRKYLDDDRRLRFYDEPRNLLYRSFLEILEELKPKVVLIENVREFLRAKGGRFAEDLLERLDELGYSASAEKLSAADFGVPQFRHRAFILATKRPIIAAFPIETYSESPDMYRDPYVSVRDAIGDLPPPTWTQQSDVIPYHRGAKPSRYASSLMSKDGLVRNHVARPLSPKTLERVRAVGHGRMRDIDESLRTRKFYGSAYGRLHWDRPSLTITTWVYHVGSGRFAHPEEDRGITMREAARLQSFDDDFKFPPLINPVSQMIGNAIPPLVGEAFGSVIARALDRATNSPTNDAAPTQCIPA
jgi:DNA (cytosine-5)-methyltransferase 1